MSSSTQIIKNSTILYVRMFITMLIGFYSSRIVLDTLGVDDYGLYTVVGGFVAMLGFLGAVMVSATNRFIACEIGRGKKNEINKVFSASLLIHLLLAILILLLAETVGLFYIYNILNVLPEQMSDAVFTFQFSLLTSLSSIIVVPYIALMTAYEDFSYIAKASIVQSVALLGAIICIEYVHFQALRIYVLSVFVITILYNIAIYIHCKKSYSSVKFLLVKDKKIYKSVASFSVWVMFGAAASMGRNQGVSLILNNFFGVALNSAFGLAMTVNNLVNQFAQNVMNAFVPQITKQQASGDNASALYLTLRSSKFAFFMMYLLALPVLLKPDFLFALWLKKIPDYTVIFCQLMIIEALFRTTCTGFTTLMFAGGNIRLFQVITSLLLLLNLPISYYLLAMGNAPQSIVVGSIFATTLMCLSQFYFIHKYFQMNLTMFAKNVLVKILLVVICTIPLFFFDKSTTDSFWEHVRGLLFAEALLISAIYYLGLNTQERLFVLGFIKNRIKYGAKN